jgi:GNAT superfamily N-acetyltransferase
MRCTKARLAFMIDAMTSVVSFERGHADQVVALWRMLHPDWTWLDDPAAAANLFERSDNRERIRYVVQRGDAVIATAFASLTQGPAWTRNRIIDVQARPEDISADWLDVILGSLVAADRGQPDTWHVVNAAACLSPVLGRLLETEGFVRSFKVWRIEWSGVSVTVADPAPIRFERYAGGRREIDAAIVDLHNRSYRAARPKPPADFATLWKSHTGLQMREYLLAMGDDRLIGYAEWWIVDGEAWINSFAVVRSHWGTAIAGTLLAKVMQVLVELGHRKIAAVVRSTNTAVMRRWQELGWKVAAELSDTFVRKL